MKNEEDGKEGWRRRRRGMEEGEEKVKDTVTRRRERRRITKEKEAALLEMNTHRCTIPMPPISFISPSRSTTL